MVRSMTGFGAGRGESEAESVVVEVRSVNGKFCDVKPHLPRELAGVEGEVVKAVKARLARGSVDVYVRRESAGGTRAVVPRIDRPLAAAYVAALEELRGDLSLSGSCSLSEVAALPGVVSLVEAPADLTAATAAVGQALAAALTALEAMRAKEGSALAKDLAARIDAIERAALEITKLSPASVEQYRERLTARVQELSRGMAVDPARLTQEVVFFADRVDVAEELTRLQSHLSQLRGLLASPEPVGRRLEFVVQEVNREVNTIGSKSQHAAIAAQVVDLKAELERIREQIQNIE